MSQIRDVEGFEEIRAGVRALCAEFPDEYFRKIDAERGYPGEFVDALTRAGWLAGLIPAEYGGSGLSLAEASVVMEEINRSGGNSGACHGQVYVMNVLVRHGSEAQRRQYLPKIAAGELRMQSMAVTEPSTGTDTTKLKTFAARKGDRYVINGQKVWISRVQHSDLMILLARTTPLAEVSRKSDGLSVFLVDLREAIGKGLSLRAIPNMVNHETNELFFDNLEIPVENLIGEEGKGFKYILDGLNAEGGRNMRFPSTRPADQDHVLSCVHELTSVQLAHEGFVDLAGSEVKTREILVSRKARCLHVVGNGTHLTFCHFRLEQL